VVRGPWSGGIAGLPATGDGASPAILAAAPLPATVLLHAAPTPVQPYSHNARPPLPPPRLAA